MDNSLIERKNYGYLPAIDDEGYFQKNLPKPPSSSSAATEQTNWFKTLTPFERLFYHQTLSSARRFAKFIPNPTRATTTSSTKNENKNSIDGHSLDFILDSIYEHQSDLFATKMDCVMQKETICTNDVEAGRRRRQTYRRLRNTIDIPSEKIIPIGHPIQIGDGLLTQNISPHSIKLICSGQHTPLTNPGYSRQKGDGNFYYY